MMDKINDLLDRYLTAETDVANDILEDIQRELNAIGDHIERLHAVNMIIDRVLESADVKVKKSGISV